MPPRSTTAPPGWPSASSAPAASASCLPQRSPGRAPRRRGLGRLRRFPPSGRRPAPRHAGAPPPEVIAAAELVLLTVPDDVLPGLVDGLAAAGDVRTGQLVVHTSGRYGVAVLDPATRAGALPLALHPAMTFTGRHEDLARLDGAASASPHPSRCGPSRRRSSSRWEASRSGSRRSCGRSTTRPSPAAPTTSRPWSTSRSTCCGAAASTSPARMLAPLLGAALDNALRSGDHALTGPVARGDAGTVAAHVRELREVSPDTAAAYVAMARLTADRALAAGLLKPAAAEALLEVLAEGAPMTTDSCTPAQSCAVRWPTATGEIGVVMSLGALHDGHRALIKVARRRCELIVVTVFLNPLQFAPSEDLSRYPRTLDVRRRAVRRGGCRPGVRAGRRRGLPGGPAAGAGACRAARRRARGRVATRALRRRAHRRRQAAAHHRAGRHVLRAEGRPAGAARAADGQRPRLPVRGRRRPDRARRRRAGAVQPQHVPLRQVDRARRSRCPGRSPQGWLRRSPEPTPCAGQLATCSTPSPAYALDYLALVDPSTLADVPDGTVGAALLVVAARVGTTRLIDNASSPSDGLVMLLAIDVGNTNTVLGLFDGEELVDTGGSRPTRTAPPTRSLSCCTVCSRSTPARPGGRRRHRGLLDRAGGAARGARLCRRYYADVPSIIVEPGVKTGVPLLNDNPSELGADRIVNTLAAFHLYGGPASSSTSARPRTTTWCRPRASSSVARSHRASRSPSTRLALGAPGCSRSSWPGRARSSASRPPRRCSRASCTASSARSTASCAGSPPSLSGRTVTRTT